MVGLPERVSPDLAKAARRRLAEMTEVVARVSEWAGGPTQAMAWYRAQPIAAFDHETAETLVKSDRAAALNNYIEAIGHGGYA